MPSVSSSREIVEDVPDEVRTEAMIHHEALMARMMKERMARTERYVQLAESRRMRREARRQAVEAFRYRTTEWLMSPPTTAARTASEARERRASEDGKRRELVERLRRAANPCGRVSLSR